MPIALVPLVTVASSAFVYAEVDATDRKALVVYDSSVLPAYNDRVCPRVEVGNVVRRILMFALILIVIPFLMLAPIEA